MKQDTVRNGRRSDGRNSVNGEALDEVKLRVTYV